VDTSPPRGLSSVIDVGDEGEIGMWRKSWLVVVLSAVALAGPMLGDARAKKPKPRFTARVNGKPLKALKRAVTLVYSTTSFSLAGPTKPQPRRGLSRTITASCLGNLKTLALPATLSCYGTYTEAGRHGAKDWVSNGMEVTIQSLDATNRVVGAFRGTLPATTAHAGDPPVAIEGGSFSIVLTDIGV
jgi:hypothetical protein